MSAYTESKRRADVLVLLARIDALQELLIVYRTGGRPSETLFARMDRTARAELSVRMSMDVAGTVLA